MKFLEFIKKLFGPKEEEIQFPAPKVKKPRKPATKRVAIKEPKKKEK